MNETQCMNPEWHKLNDGKWRHIIVVDGSLYIDGVEVVEKQG